MRRGALALLVPVLVFGGCDDDSPDSASSQDTTTSTTLSQDEATSTTASPDMPGSTIDTNFASPGDERFCRLARSYIEHFTRRPAPGDTRGFGEALQDARSIVLQMQEIAPEEIVDDLLRLAGILDVVVPALEAADFDLSQLPPDVLQMLQDPDFRAAAERLQAYTETACQPV